MPPCSGADTGRNITRRESGLTSLRCLGTRTTEESVQKVLQMSVALFHWCSLPLFTQRTRTVHGFPMGVEMGIDFCLVSYSQQVV